MRPFEIYITVIVAVVVTALGTFYFLYKKFYTGSKGSFTMGTSSSIGPTSHDFAYPDVGKKNSIGMPIVEVDNGWRLYNGNNVNIVEGRNLKKPRSMYEGSSDADSTGLHGFLSTLFRFGSLTNGGVFQTGRGGNTGVESGNSHSTAEENFTLFRAHKKDRGVVDNSEDGELTKEEEVNSEEEVQSVGGHKIEDEEEEETEGEYNFNKNNNMEDQNYEVEDGDKDYDSYETVTNAEEENNYTMNDFGDEEENTERRINKEEKEITEDDSNDEHIDNNINNFEQENNEDGNEKSISEELENKEETNDYDYASYHEDGRIEVEEKNKNDSKEVINNEMEEFTHDNFEAGGNKDDEEPNKHCNEQESNDDTINYENNNYEKVGENMEKGYSEELEKNNEINYHKGEYNIEEIIMDDTSINNERIKGGQEKTENEDESFNEEELTDIEVNYFDESRRVEDSKDEENY